MTPINPQDFQQRVIDSLARLETKMETLVGTDSYPGRVPKIEERLDELEVLASEARGASRLGAILISFAMSFIALVFTAIQYFKKS